MASSQDKKANTLRNVEVSMARAQEIMLFCLKEIFNAMDEDELDASMVIYMDVFVVFSSFYTNFLF